MILNDNLVIDRYLKTDRQTDRQTDSRWVRTPPGSDIFSLSPCGPISLLGLSLRRYYLGYLLEHFNLPHLNHCRYSIGLIKKGLYGMFFLREV